MLCTGKDPSCYTYVAELNRMDKRIPSLCRLLTEALQRQENIGLAGCMSKYSSVLGFGCAVSRILDYNVNRKGNQNDTTAEPLYLSHDNNKATFKL